MSNNRILITGASGYIGTHVVSLLLKKNYVIHAFSRFSQVDKIEKNVVWHQIDLLNTNKIEKLIDQIKPTFLIHLAWKIGSGLKHDSIENNEWLAKSKLLISSFYKSGGQRVLVTGTCAEYDWNYEKLSELGTPLKPKNIYGKVKNELFNYLQSYCYINNYSYVWPRIFFSFGPNQNKKSLMPSIINSLKSDKIVETTHGEQMFDYLYIEDVASAIILLLECDYNGAVNIASGKSIKVKYLIEKIANYFNKAELVHYGKILQPEEAPNSILGTNKILRSVTNWSQKFSLEAGLEKTIKHYKKEIS